MQFGDQQSFCYLYVDLLFITLALIKVRILSFCPIIINYNSWYQFLVYLGKHICILNNCQHLAVYLFDNYTTSRFISSLRAKWNTLSTQKPGQKLEHPEPRIQKSEPERPLSCVAQSHVCTTGSNLQSAKLDEVLTLRLN